MTPKIKLLSSTMSVPQAITRPPAAEVMTIALAFSWKNGENKKRDRESQRTRKKRAIECQHHRYTQGLSLICLGQRHTRKPKGETERQRQRQRHRERGEEETAAVRSQNLGADRPNEPNQAPLPFLRNPVHQTQPANHEAEDRQRDHQEGSRNQPVGKKRERLFVTGKKKKKKWIISADLPHTSQKENRTRPPSPHNKRTHARTPGAVTGGEMAALLELDQL